MGTINGVVKDKNTQEILIGVVLKFAGKDTVNTLSDENGNFSVQLPVGKYNLETSHIGYTPFTLYNINLTSGNAQILRFTRMGCVLRCSDTPYLSGLSYTGKQAQNQNQARSAVLKVAEIHPAPAPTPDWLEARMLKQ